MALSAEEVIWGYRFVLGRDPESQQAIEFHQQTKDRATLLQHLIYCEEYLSRPGSIVPIALHMQVATNDVILDATPTQHEAMLARISAAWRAYGESEPHGRSSPMPHISAIRSPKASTPSTPRVRRRSSFVSQPFPGTA